MSLDSGFPFIPVSPKCVVETRFSNESSVSSQSGLIHRFWFVMILCYHFVLLSLVIFGGSDLFLLSTFFFLYTFLCDSRAIFSVCLVFVYFYPCFRINLSNPWLLQRALYLPSLPYLLLISHFSLLLLFSPSLFPSPPVTSPHVPPVSPFSLSPLLRTCQRGPLVHLAN